MIRNRSANSWTLHVNRVSMWMEMVVLSSAMLGVWHWGRGVIKNHSDVKNPTGTTTCFLHSSTLMAALAASALGQGDRC